MFNSAKDTEIRIFGVGRYGTRYYNEPCQVQRAVPIVIVGTFIIVPLSVLVNIKARKEVFFVNNSKFTDFGLCVKTELLRQGKDQKWLEEQVTEKTGLFVDSGYIDEDLPDCLNLIYHLQ